MNEETILNSEITEDNTETFETTAVNDDISDDSTHYDTLYRYESANIVVLVMILIAVCANLGATLAVAFWKR